MAQDVTSYPVFEYAAMYPGDLLSFYPGAGLVCRVPRDAVLTVLEVPTESYVDRLIRALILAQRKARELPPGWSLYVRSLRTAVDEPNVFLESCWRSFSSYIRNEIVGTLEFAWRTLEWLAQIDACIEGSLPPLVISSLVGDEPLPSLDELPAECAPLRDIRDALDAVRHRWNQLLQADLAEIVEFLGEFLVAALEVLAEADLAGWLDEIVEDAESLGAAYGLISGIIAYEVMDTVLTGKLGKLSKLPRLAEGIR